MTPEERQLLTSTLDKVKAMPVADKDAEADGLIRDLVQSKPEAPYILTQAVIIQDMAMQHAQEQLQAAQSQIANLQRQLADAQSSGAQGAPPQKSGGFLSGIFGGSSQQAPSGSVPSVNPWGRPLNQGNPNPGFGQQAYAQQPNYAPGGYPQQGAAPVFQPQSSGFLRSAAQTALGVAGGALLFQGVESMFGGHSGFGGFGGGGFGGGGFGGGGWGGGGQENITEVTNNYYDSSPNDAPASDPGYDPGYDQNADPGIDQGGGFDDSSFDTGGDSSGGGDDWV